MTSKMDSTSRVTSARRVTVGQLKVARTPQGRGLPFETLVSQVCGPRPRLGTRPARHVRCACNEPVDVAIRRQLAVRVLRWQRRRWQLERDDEASRRSWRNAAHRSRSCMCASPTLTWPPLRVHRLPTARTCSSRRRSCADAPQAPFPLTNSPRLHRWHGIALCRAGTGCAQ